jgi:hypothetical protein
VRISFPHRYQVHQASERFLSNFALAIDQMHRNLQKDFRFHDFRRDVSGFNAFRMDAFHFDSFRFATGLSTRVDTASIFESTPAPYIGGKLSDPCDAWNVCCEVFELRRFAAFATFPFRHFALRTFWLRYRSNLYLSCVHQGIFSVTPAP